MERFYTLMLAIVSTIFSVHIKSLPPINFQPDRPVTTTNQPRTVELPYAEVTKNNGTQAELITPEGEVYIVRSLPIGKYMDVRIVDRQLKSATPLIRELCNPGMQPWFIPPDMYDQSNCP